MSGDVVFVVDGGSLSTIARRVMFQKGSILAERPAAGRIPSRRIRRLMHILARQEIAQRRVFQAALTSRFRELGRRTATIYRAQGVKAAQPEPPTGDELLIVTQIMLLLDTAGWRDIVRRGEYVRHYARVVHATGETLEAVLGLGMMIPDPVEAAIIAAGGRRAGLIDLTAQTRAALMAALREGRELGEGPAALAKRIEQHVAAGRYQDVKTRARLIARTETKYAQNVSTLEAYQQSPAVTGVIAYDNRTGFGDADCVARDGQFFTFADAAIETENEHPNGTLSWGPATGG